MLSVGFLLLLAGATVFLLTRPPRPDAAPAAPAAPQTAETTATTLAAKTARTAPAVPRPPSDAPARPAGGTLRVAVEGVTPGDASVAFALFADAAAFEAATPSRKARLGPGETTWTLEGLARGTYAVKAYVDRDGNGALNRGAFGAPSEPYGFSNDARGAFGPPSFADAAFTFDGKSLSIRFRVR